MIWIQLMTLYFIMNVASTVIFWFVSGAVESKSRYLFAMLLMGSLIAALYIVVYAAAMAYAKKHKKEKETDDA